MSGRRLARIAGVAVMALVLAGCFRVQMNVEVSPENTVSGDAVIAVDESLIELSGQSPDQLFEDMDLSDLPPGAEAERYEEDGFIGQRITFAEVPLEDFTSGDSLTAGGPGEELRIVRQGDEFHVSGAMDMSGEEFTGGEQVPRQFLDSFEFTISITFPGEVRSATGEIDGNTVTWQPRIGENTRIDAVASAIPSGTSPLLIVLLIVGALAVLAILFLVMRRRTPATAAGPIDDAAASSWSGASIPPVAPAPATAPVEGSRSTAPMPVETPTPAPPATDETSTRPASPIETDDEDDTPPPSTTT
jgi:hypothetical protein